MGREREVTLCAFTSRGSAELTTILTPRPPPAPVSDGRIGVTVGYGMAGRGPEPATRKSMRRVAGVRLAACVEPSVAAAAVAVLRPLLVSVATRWCRDGDAPAIAPPWVAPMASSVL